MTTREVVLDGGSPWGFRLHGGADVNQPLRISRVSHHHARVPFTRACFIFGLFTRACLCLSVAVFGSDLRFARFWYVAFVWDFAARSVGMRLCIFFVAKVRLMVFRCRIELYSGREYDKLWGFDGTDVL